MLSQDGKGKLVVKVIDFGIAKQLAEGDGGQGLTQTGMFLGKLKYASPEQAGFLKEGEHLDPRSDLYSFGIVMYEMLAGRAPFQATNPHGYILKHVTEKPAAIAELNPAVRVPSQLEAIIMRSLEKSRDARYATAEEFANALQAVRNTIPPDQKYGLGERMVTLSGAQTLADLKMSSTGSGPQITASGAQPTQQTYAGGTLSGGTMSDATVARAPLAGGTVPGAPMPGTGPTGTRPGSEDATVMERHLTASPKTIGSNDATVMERLDGAAAAPTAIEQKWTAGTPQGEATVLERQVAPPKKRNVALIAAAAAVVIVLAVIAAVVLRKPDAPAVANAPTETAGTQITATGAPGAIDPAEGVLLLSASPWGEIERIVSKNDRREVPLEQKDLTTPTRIELAPGDYVVTLSGEEGTQTVDVQIQAGKHTQKNVRMRDLNFEELTQEVTKQ
jgi:hypothetical protein